MIVKLDARIVNGDIEKVLPSGDVIISNAIIIAETNSSVYGAESSRERISGKLLSAMQAVIPTLTLNKSDVFKLPTHMQFEIRRREGKSDARNT